MAVGAEAGKLAEVRLDATGDVLRAARRGCVTRSGKTKTVTLGAPARQCPLTRSDVGDQLVDSVIVTTDRTGKGSYSVLGMPVRATSQSA